MRALVTIAVLGWVLYRTLASGNYLRIRFYVAALLLTQLAGEGYLWLAGTDHDTAYWAIYSAGTAAILATAWLVSTELVLRNPLRRVVIPLAYLAAAAAFLLNRSDVLTIPAPVLLLLVQAFFLTVAAMQTLASLPVIFSQAEYVNGLDLPARAVGQLWLAQAIMFHLFARGVPLYPAAWNAYGEWLPAGLLIAFMLRLGYHLKPLPPLTHQTG